MLVIHALFKIVDLTKSDPTGVCQITEIEHSPDNKDPLADQSQVRTGPSQTRLTEWYSVSILHV